MDWARESRWGCTACSEPFLEAKALLQRWSLLRRQLRHTLCHFLFSSACTCKIVNDLHQTHSNLLRISSATFWHKYGRQPHLDAPTVLSLALSGVLVINGKNTDYIWRWAESLWFWSLVAGCTDIASLLVHFDSGRLDFLMCSWEQKWAVIVAVSAPTPAGKPTTVCYKTLATPTTSWPFLLKIMQNQTKWALDPIELFYWQHRPTKKLEAVCNNLNLGLLFILTASPFQSFCNQLWRFLQAKQ